MGDDERICAIEFISGGFDDGMADSDCVTAHVVGGDGHYGK